MQTLREMRPLLTILAVCALIALVEYQRTRAFGHLQPRSSPKSLPSLKGESLHELASVLIELYPAEAQPNALMGTALAAEGKLSQARVHLEKALEGNPRDQSLLFMYARLLLDMGEDPQKVRAVVEEIRRYFPRSRQKIEDYFERASKGQIRFEQEALDPGGSAPDTWY